MLQHVKFCKQIKIKSLNYFTVDLGSNLHQY